MQMENILSPKFSSVVMRDYIITTKRGDKYLVKASCYALSFYGWYLFYSEDPKEVSKIVRSEGVLPVKFEISKRDVSSIIEDGCVEKINKPKNKRRPPSNKKAPAKKKTKRNSLRIV